MPLIIPKELPAAQALANENIFVMHEARAQKQDIRPLKILVVNLMPTKVATETQLARMLANTPLQVELTLLHMGTHRSKNTSEAHLNSFYKTYREVCLNRYDGMIITGAPVENLPYEEVDYWPELCKLMEFSKTQVFSTLHLCWGAQAALYYHYGIPKHPLEHKMFGVFLHQVLTPHEPLVRGFDEEFFAPQSRHTEVRREDVEKVPSLKIVAVSPEAGLHILMGKNGRQIFLCGHQEYDRDTLKAEYDRDIKKGRDIAVPRHYFENDDPHGRVLFRWRSHASLLFSNWLNYYVYQETPYDFTD